MGIPIHYRTDSNMSQLSLTIYVALALIAQVYGCGCGCGEPAPLTPTVSTCMQAPLPVYRPAPPPAYYRPAPQLPQVQYCMAAPAPLPPQSLCYAAPPAPKPCLPLKLKCKPALDLEALKAKILAKKQKLFGYKCQVMPTCY